MLYFSSMKNSMYHVLLRVSALTMSLVLLFVSGIVSPVTKQLSENTGQYLANVIGVGASVAPNEYNVITARLTEQEQALKAREAALFEREIAVNLNTETTSGSDRTTFLLSGILFILLVLIVLNYVLDYIRKRPLNETHNKLNRTPQTS